MSDKRDIIRDQIIKIQNGCFDMVDAEDRTCRECPFNNACTFLMAFDDWLHIHKRLKPGDEDLERLVDQVMEIDDCEELLEV